MAEAFLRYQGKVIFTSHDRGFTIARLDDQKRQTNGQLMTATDPAEASACITKPQRLRRS